MKKTIIILAFLTSLIAVTQLSLAVKAYPYPIEINQPNGTKLKILLKGDEHIKWAQTVDGYSIMRNGKGIFEYALFDSKGNMILSGINAQNLSERGSSDILFLNKVGKGIYYSNIQVGMMKSISKMVQKSYQQPFPTTGNVKIACILIGFTDKAFTKTITEFTNLFNQVGYSGNGASGSVHDYYLENSYNQLNLTFTVVGPYTASQNMAYYGANKINGDDIRPRELVTEAVNLADASLNYANFDNNGDGYVDGIYVIHSGYGEEAGADANTIWSHAWSIPSISRDGKIVSDYTCSPELEGTTGSSITSIGVICHEFGHVMGALDFYDTDSPSSSSFEGTGDWDVMANGSWNNNGATPAHHNPYTKIYVYGWAAATIISAASFITLNNSEVYSNSFYRINTSTANEYFLIENRQKQKFDYYLPGHGMIIYHVDGSYINSNLYTINSSSHQGLYPVCASASTNPSTTIASYGDINSGGCPFPGTFLKTTFNDYSTPNSRSWTGINLDKSITNISENTANKTVSFNVSITTGIETNEIRENNLSRSYPNPFDLSTKIDFKLVKPGKVNLTVYNSLGQIVDVIIDEFLPAGNHSKPWTPKGIASGIYFYQLKADGVKETKRLIKK